jgi:hypothetical protein
MDIYQGLEEVRDKIKQKLCALYKKYLFLISLIYA